MKVIIPKSKPLTPNQYRKLVETLTQVNCCKCGRNIQVMSMAYATLNFDKKRYENKLCDKCKKESEDTE